MNMYTPNYASPRVEIKRSQPVGGLELQFALMLKKYFLMRYVNLYITSYSL
jgi:hypothetical protein